MYCKITSPAGKAKIMSVGESMGISREQMENAIFKKNEIMNALKKEAIQAGKRLQAMEPELASALQVSLTLFVPY